jgi:hypothetical protein
MSYKHTMPINETWSHTGAAGLSPVGIFARLLNAIKIEIPTGYQDESGFHAGVKPAEKEIKWPATW